VLRKRLLHGGLSVQIVASKSRFVIVVMRFSFSYKQDFPLLQGNKGNKGNKMNRTSQIIQPVPKPNPSPMHAFPASSIFPKGEFFKNAMSRIRFHLPTRQNLHKIMKAPHAPMTDAADLLKCPFPKTLEGDKIYVDHVESTLDDELFLDLTSSFMQENLNNSSRKSSIRLSSDIVRQSLEMARKSTDSLDDLLSDLLRGSQRPQKFLEMKVEPERKSTLADLLQPAEHFFKSSTKTFSSPRLQGHEQPN
jgi:hypothetical protein